MVFRRHGVLLGLHTHPWDVGRSQVSLGTLGTVCQESP
jgi:hypothetical protein